MGHELEMAHYWKNKTISLKDVAILVELINKY